MRKAGPNNGRPIRKGKALKEDIEWLNQAADKAESANELVTFGNASAGMQLTCTPANARIAAEMLKSASDKSVVSFILSVSTQVSGLPYGTTYDDYMNFVSPRRRRFTTRKPARTIGRDSDIQGNDTRGKVNQAGASGHTTVHRERASIPQGRISTLRTALL